MESPVSGVTLPPSVLVVDDNPLIQNVVKSLLQAAQYNVFTSSNGKEALDLLKDKTVDVIVCDVMMPEMDGYELHRQIRQRADLAHVPFVFLSALGEEPEIQQGKETGADDYLVKPFDPESLLAVVKGKVIRSRTLRQVAEEQYDSYRKRVIHTLSHEFRTPLVAINTGAELLLEKDNSVDEKTARRLIEAIARGGQRLEKLVTDFMLLQQLEAGIALRLYESKKKELGLNQLARAIYDAERDHFSELETALILSPCYEELRVEAYEPQIRDIVTRLLENAVKFSTKVKEVELVVCKHDQVACIEVRDRGIGIDPEKTREAVDVFGQINRDRLEQQGGGLGLSIANRYAAINKARLDFARRDGGGSIVSLLLPRV